MFKWVIKMREIKQMEKKGEKVADAAAKMRKFSFRKIAAASMLAVSTLLPVRALAEDGFMNIYPAYNTKAQYATIRLEGGVKPMDKINVYGFADIDATKQKPADMENVYAEVRVAYSVAKALGLAAEYNGGNSMKDIVRLGAVFMPKIAEGNFTLIKLFPIETSGERGPQVSVYASQEITKRITASIVADYNTKSRTIYLEPELLVKIVKSTSMFVQGRGFGPIDGKIDFAPVVGVKIQLN